MRRRTFLRTTGTVLAAAGLNSCRRETPSQPVLRVMSWSDYFDPATVAAFEKEQSCRVEFAVFASNEELLARLTAGEEADLLVPTTYMRLLLQEEGRLAPLEAGSGAPCSAPYLRGVSGLAWTDERDTPCSWSWITNTPAGRLTLLDDVRETLGAALKFLGYSANSPHEAQIREAVAVIQDWKQRISAFESEYYKLGLVAGEYDLVHGYSGDVLQAAHRNPQIRFDIPMEGALISTDELCIDSRSRLKELAAAFIRRQTSPEALAAHARHTCCQPAAIDPTSWTGVDADAIARSEEIAPLGDAADLWHTAWREIRRD